MDQVAPYNTFYPRLEAHLAQVGVDSTVNRWDRVLTLGAVDPHDAYIHPAGVADAQAEGATVLQPEKFTTFMVCTILGSRSSLRCRVSYKFQQCIPHTCGLHVCSSCFDAGEDSVVKSVISAVSKKLLGCPA